MIDWFTEILSDPGVSPRALATLAAVYGALTLATVIAGVLRLRRGDEARELWERIISWWWMISLAAGSLFLGRLGALLFFSFVSYLALQEFLSIVPSRREDRPVILAAFLVIPINAALIWFERYGIFLIFIPVYAFVIFPFLLVIAGQVRRVLAFMGALHWGMMLTVYNLSYVPYMMVLSAKQAPQGGAALVIALLVLTELNDVAQYIFGKLIGGAKIVPQVSPGKTWAGFFGGMLVTIIATLLLAPWLTPLSYFEASILGPVLGLAGFAGDVTMSAIKRDLGLKDTSALIPGHGGVLDRIDSLTFSAPLYFHIIVFFH